ncbi:c-type cytochrome [Stappia sp.]|uniref:c-type cytochrome n=1 Tax=Stappia sp. TaxID=1870903 RepID=UPI003C7D99AA
MRGSGGYAVVLAAAFFVLGTGDALANDPLLDQGRKIFRKCQSCHQVGVNAKHTVGPLLNDIYGRRAGTLEGYRYSRAMEAAGQDGLVWSEEALSAYLEDPKSAVHGTKMNFGGLRDPDDRRAVVAFLRQFSPGAANIPEAPPTAPLENADPEVPPHILALEGDPDYGEYLSSECVTCHQADGEDKGIPSITGWPGDRFVTVMHAYKTKSRDNPVMQSIAASLSDEEIAALAAYFSKAGQ